MSVLLETSIDFVAGTFVDGRRWLPDIESALPDRGGRSGAGRDFGIRDKGQEGPTKPSEVKMNRGWEFSWDAYAVTGTLGMTGGACSPV